MHFLSVDICILSETFSVMSNATVKMIENYKDTDPNFTIARQHEHHREEQEQMEKLRKVRARLFKALLTKQCH